jgi:hypothetical protein
MVISGGLARLGSFCSRSHDRDDAGAALSDSSVGLVFGLKGISIAHNFHTALLEKCHEQVCARLLLTSVLTETHALVLGGPEVWYGPRCPY